MFKTIEPGLF